MKHYLHTHKTQIVLFCVIVVLGFLLRIYNLTLVPVFADEAIYLRWAQVMRAETTLRFLPQIDGKQPLFMWAVIPALKLFADPLLAGRLVSVSAGVGTMVGIFVLSKILFNSFRISLLALLFYAISPFSVFFDRLALVDSMLAMFGVWTFIFAVVTVKKVRLDTAMLAGFALGGGLLTKSPANFYAMLLPFSLILHKWPKGLKPKFTKASFFVFLFTFTYVIAYGMYNILRLGPNFHMIALRNKDYVYPLSHFLTSPFDPFLPFFHRSLEYFWILGPGVLSVFLLVGLVFGLKEKIKEILLITVWGLFPILVVSEFSKTMTARYIFFSLPYFYILAAFGLNLILPGEKSKNASQLRLRVAKGWLPGVIAGLIFFVHSLYSDYLLLTSPQQANLPRSERSGFFEEWTSGYGIKEVSEFLRNESKNLPAGRQVVVGTEGYFGTLPDGLQIYLNSLPEITVIGVGLPINEVPVQLAESRHSGNKTYLVVNRSRFFGDLSGSKLKIVSEFPKALRPDGTRDSLLFFEVTGKE